MAVSEERTNVALATAGMRVPPLEGGRNFRDLGGYSAADGRQVKWGVLFRSGSPAGLTQADWEYLTARGVRALCDLRSSGEREAEPFAWRETADFLYWARDYTTSFGELRAILASNLATAEAAKEAMLTGYRRLPFEQAPAYRQIFQHLKANNVPLIFNCSAGKDRAGTAAALILTALGVPRALVLEDYALTSRYLHFKLGNAREGSLLGRQPPGVVEAILGCDADYLNAGLDAIDERCGSFPAYLRDMLDVEERDIETIRSALLE